MARLLRDPGAQSTYFIRHPKHPTLVIDDVFKMYHITQEIDGDISIQPVSCEAELNELLKTL